MAGLRCCSEQLFRSLKVPSHQDLAADVANPFGIEVSELLLRLNVPLQSTTFEKAKLFR